MAMQKAYRGDLRFRRYPPVSDAMYRSIYLDLLRDNFKRHSELFRQLLERDSITLTCYCGKDKTYCHRIILATYILPRCAHYFGIDYEDIGER